MFSSGVLILIVFELNLIHKMELTVNMVVLPLMHNLHLSALVSLAYMPHFAVVTGQGIPDASLTLPSSENEKEVGLCACICACVRACVWHCGVCVCFVVCT